MEKVEELLGKILKELEYHGKLLGELVQGVDSKRHEHKISMMEAQKKISDLASKLGNSPFADVLMETAKAMTGGKHGD